MITRKHCPGPWADAVADCFTRYRKLAPQLGLEHCGKKFGLTGGEVVAIWLWCRDFAKKPLMKKQPCPV